MFFNPSLRYKMMDKKRSGKPTPTKSVFAFAANGLWSPAPVSDGFPCRKSFACLCVIWEEVHFHISVDTQMSFWKHFIWNNFICYSYVSDLFLFVSAAERSRHCRMLTSRLPLRKIFQISNMEQRISWISHGQILDKISVYPENI